MNTVVVFTRKNLNMIFENGGCGDWVANESRLSKCTYLVATANALAPGSRLPTSKHSHAFLVGKVSGIKEAPGDPRRKVIQIDAYAEVDIPKCWDKQRNPVRYASLSDFGIDPESIDWKPFPVEMEKYEDLTPELTIEEAKRGIAKKLGIIPECVEIVIRA